MRLRRLAAAAVVLLSSVALVGSASFDCVHLIRSITEKGERGDEPVLAFETYVRIETAPGGQAQRLVPRSLTLARAAALTDRQSRKVDTSVEIKIDAIAGGEKIIEKVAVADQTLKFAGLQTPGGGRIRRARVLHPSRYPHW